MSGGTALEVRLEVRPRWVFRLSRRTGLDRVARVRGGVLHRLLHCGDAPVVVRVAQLSEDRVLFGARSHSREVAEWGIERMRGALGIDQDLRPFYERFRFDPLIGPAVRANPGLRVAGRPHAFEALVWQIAEVYARDRGVSLSDCWFYTDSYSDLPVLERIGHPVVVNPDPRLRREAERRGWPVEWWEEALSGADPGPSLFAGTQPGS